MIDINKIKEFILGKGEWVKEDVRGGYRGYYKQTEPNIFGKLVGYGEKFANRGGLISPRVEDYSSAPTPTLAQDYGMAQMPSLTPAPAPTRDPFQFPLGDKPSVPTQYHEQLSSLPNANILAGVLAQETGGYGYKPYDSETGEILESWNEARARRLAGPAGEVGIAQIVPKWWWKDAGFPSEEEYADALYDPNFSISEMSRIINRAFQIYGDWRKALNTWNKSPVYADQVLGRIGAPVQ